MSVENPLLLNDNNIVEGVVDFKNQPVNRSIIGGWKSASFIIGVEMAERVAFYGIGSNLISYLTGPLGQSTATAAENVNAWSGTASLLPLVGAFLADSFLGRYRAIFISSGLYVLFLCLASTVLRKGMDYSDRGEQAIRQEDSEIAEALFDQAAEYWKQALGLLTLSAVLPFQADCQNAVDIASCHPPRTQVVFFFFSLYLVAVAQAGHKPCVQAFGADQFDSQDPQECKAKSSFFNWWYFCLCASSMTALLVLNYIQDNLNWGLGFGLPCIVMAIALGIFLVGTTSYRFSIRSEEKSPFVRIGRVFVRAAKNWQTTPSAIATEEEAQGLLLHPISCQYKFLNKALLASDGSMDPENVCTINEIEEAKAVLRLIPIWTTCLVYATVFAQSSTLFTKQGLTMDRSIGPNFNVPPATLQSFISLSVLIFIPIYDRILVPTARAITRKPSGITMLQRIGTGIVLSALAMIIAAIVERKRLQTAIDYGLVDKPKVTVPMSVWWLIPQYVLFGVSDVFTMVGLQEFFYDQVPSELKSMGLSLYLSIFGVGSFLSSFLISIVENITGADGKDSWFSDNLNRAHLDYFYCVLAGLSAVALVAYLYFAKSYIYNRVNTV